MLFFSDKAQGLWPEQGWGFRVTGERTPVRLVDRIDLEPGGGCWELAIPAEEVLT